MRSQSFSWSTSVLTKAGILIVSGLCLVFIGWSIPETAKRHASQMALKGPAHAPDTVKSDFQGQSQRSIQLVRSSQRVDVNQGTRADLEGLPGIGPVLAQRIIDHRETHGPFKTISGLTAVKGIGRVRMTSLRSKVSIGGTESPQTAQPSSFPSSEAEDEKE